MYDLRSILKKKYFFRFISVTKQDFIEPNVSLPSHHHRTLTFCTPVVDTGGPIDTPMGLSCHTYPIYTAGEGAPDTTCSALADTLPVSWTGPAGVEHGMDLSYKSDVVIHQDICRYKYPTGRLCSASRMVARQELENVMKRYRDKDTLAKFSTPSGNKFSIPSQYEKGNLQFRCWVSTQQYQFRRDFISDSIHPTKLIPRIIIHSSHTFYFH